jgi:hypothetical protein
MSLFNDASIIITPNGVKAGKLYAVKGADLNVTRATSATRVNANGLIETVGANVPLIDHTGGGCPTILVQPQRTNLALRSDDFGNGYWGKFNTTITANNTTAPDGTTTADKFVETTANNFHSMDSTFTSGIGIHTATIFAKIGERRYLRLNITEISPAIDHTALFDLQTGTLLSSGTGVTAKIISADNGWYKISVTSPALVGGQVRMALLMQTTTSSTPQSYTGDGTSGLFIWGAQLEAGSYATSYIPTTSASVTRNADVISKTGISSLIGQTEGTLFVDFNVTRDVSGFYTLASLIGANSDIYITINTFITTGNIYAEIKNTTQQALITSSINSSRCKIALAYKANDIALYINGNLIGTDTSATIPATSAFSFEYDVNIANRNTKNINDVILWKTRLTNAELAELTNL